MKSIISVKSVAPAILTLLCLAFASPRQQPSHNAPMAPRFAQASYTRAGAFPAAPQPVQRVSMASLASVRPGQQVCVTNKFTGVICVTQGTNTGPAFTGTNIVPLSFQVPATNRQWSIQSTPDLTHWTTLVTYPTGGSNFWTFRNTGRVMFTDQTTNQQSWYREAVSLP